MYRYLSRTRPSHCLSKRQIKSVCANVRAENLHSSWIRRASLTLGSDIFAGSPKQYTVSPPIGGKKVLMSPRVMSSGYEPPVCSNRARLRVPSSIPNRSATPGRYQTGSTANFVTASSPDALRHILPSGISLPAFTLSSSSGTFICALVMAIVGRISTSSFWMISLKSQGDR
jgi:hypothetical protein